MADQESADPTDTAGLESITILPEGRVQIVQRGKTTLHDVGVLLLYGQWLSAPYKIGVPYRWHEAGFSDGAPQ